MFVAKIASKQPKQLYCNDIKRIYDNLSDIAGKPTIIFLRTCGVGGEFQKISLEINSCSKFKTKKKKRVLCFEFFENN